MTYLHVRFRIKLAQFRELICLGLFWWGVNSSTAISSTAISSTAQLIVLAGLATTVGSNKEITGATVSLAAYKLSMS